MRYNGIVPVYSLLTTEFTIKQKAVGNKGDKIFLSENIYDSSYFRERKRDRIMEKESEREREGGGEHNRCAKDFCEESDRSLFTGHRIRYLLAFVSS